MKKKVGFFAAVAAVVMVGVIGGCGGGGTGMPMTGTSAVVPATDSALSFAKAAELLAANGGSLPLTLYVGKGMGTTSFPVTLTNTRVDPYDDAQLGVFSVPNGERVGPGCSGGSIVLDLNMVRNKAGLTGRYLRAFMVRQGGSNSQGSVWDRFEATSVEQVEQSISAGTGRSVGGVSPKNNLTPVMAVAPAALQQSLATWHGQPAKVSFVSSGTAGLAQARGMGLGVGNSYAGMYTPNVYFAAQVAFPYMGGNLATGHGIDLVGNCALPVCMFNGDRTSDGSYNGYAAGMPMSTMVWDGPYGSLIMAGAPATAPISVSMTKGGVTTKGTSWVAQSTGSYYEHYGAFLETTIVTSKLLGQLTSIKGDASATITLMADGVTADTETTTITGSLDLVTDLSIWISSVTGNFSFSGGLGHKITGYTLVITRP